MDQQRTSPSGYTHVLLRYGLSPLGSIWEGTLSPWALAGFSIRINSGVHRAQKPLDLFNPEKSGTSQISHILVFLLTAAYLASHLKLSGSKQHRSSYSPGVRSLMWVSLGYIKAWEQELHSFSRF